LDTTTNDVAESTIFWQLDLSAAAADAKLAMAE